MKLRTRGARRLLGPIMLAVLATTMGAAAPDEAPVFAELARPHARAFGAPRAADVCFSTRWPRPLGPNDPHDSLAAARAFHATRLDWLYLTGRPADRDFIAEAKARGYSVGGTLNSNLPDAPDARTYTRGRTVNLLGEPLADPWTASWGARFGCPNNPEYATVFLAHARYALEMGVDQFQMDGPQFNDIMVSHGGCFCADCLAGFREFLAAHSTAAQREEWGIGDLATFDYAKFLTALGTPPNVGIAAWKGPADLRDRYREYQVAAGVRFLGEMHERVNELAGRRIAYSCNAARDFLTTYHRVHDYAQCESYPDREGVPAYLYEQLLRPGRELGTSFLFTFVSDDVEHTRRFIATAYALGSNVIVPWDVFTGFKTPRVFAEPEQFADLYGFVRAVAPWLEGYEEAAVVGAGIRDPRFAADRPPVQVWAAAPVLAVVRARPAETEAPVVVHLVAASPEPTGPVRLAFDPHRFFGDRPLKVRFLAPPPYAAAEHEQAETTGDYRALAPVTELVDGRVGMVELPAVSPWGMVVFEPGAEPAEPLWPPVIWGDERSRYTDTLVIRLETATPGAVVRYTLDGTEPGPTAVAYEGPLSLTETTTVRARAFDENGAASRVLSVRFERVAPRPRRAPDDAELVENLRLWLRADDLSATHADGEPVTSWPAVVGSSAVVPRASLPVGGPAEAPKFRREALAGRAAIWFDGIRSQLTVPGFANAHLAGRPFTVFLVSQSEDQEFGICGNGESGGGGVPRLYLTRGSFSYETLSRPSSVGPAPGTPAVSVYRHDGARTAWLRCGGRNGEPEGERPVVAAFGGGHLSMPFWSGNRGHAGAIAEIVVYDRCLTDPEVEAVEEDIAARQGLEHRLKWR